MKTYNSYNNIFKKIKNTTPSHRYVESQSFSNWQIKAREKLNELLGLPFEMCDDEFVVLQRKDRDGFEQIDFEFQSEVGYFVKGSFLVPNNIKQPLPTMICLQGHSTGMHISINEPKFESDVESIAGGRDFAIRTVKEGYCAVVIEQRYMGEAGQDENGVPACLTSFVAMPTLLLGRTAIGERVWDVQRLIDVLMKHFSEYVDTENIFCMGNSGGGTTTFYAACLDQRISFAIPSCSVCTYEDSIAAMEHCSCNYVPGIRKYFDMGDIGMLMANRKLIVVCGKVDPIFPLEGVKKSYELIKSGFLMNGTPENCKLIIGDGGHQFYPDDVWPIIHSMIN